MHSILSTEINKSLLSTVYFVSVPVWQLENGIDCLNFPIVRFYGFYCNEAASKSPFDVECHQSNSNKLCPIRENGS